PLVADYADGSKKEVDKDITWQTSDATVAEVSEGKVTGKGVGKAKLTARYRELVSEPFEVEVKHPSWKEIETFLDEGRAQSKQEQYSTAIMRFNEALKLKPPDKQAEEIESEIKKAQQEIDTRNKIAQIAVLVKQGKALFNQYQYLKAKD